LAFEDFHGTAEALVFPEAWAKLNDVIRPDQALLLSGGHSARDRDEEQAPFIVDGAQPLDELRAKGAIGVALVWTRTAPPPPDAARAVAALCAAHPGPCPVLVEWAEADENGASPGREPGAARRHLQEPDADAARPGRAPPEASLHPRLRQYRLHGLRRAARRPVVPRRPGDRGRVGAARRHERDGDRAPEGPRHEGEPAPQ